MTERTCRRLEGCDNIPQDVSRHLSRCAASLLLSDVPVCEWNKDSLGEYFMQEEHKKGFERLPGMYIRNSVAVETVAESLVEIEDDQVPTTSLSPTLYSVRSCYEATRDIVGLSFAIPEGATVSCSPSSNFNTYDFDPHTLVHVSKGNGTKGISFYTRITDHNALAVTELLNAPHETLVESHGIAVNVQAWYEVHGTKQAVLDWLLDLRAPKPEWIEKQ